MKIKILIADDHPVFREGLCRILADETDLEVVGKAADGEQAVSMTKELHPDVVVMDVAMPKLNGIDAAREIKTHCPGVAVLIVSAYDYESYLLASVRAGAEGYLLKNAPLPIFVSAVRMVRDGEGVINLKSAKKALDRLASVDEDKGSAEGLQPRELEVLKLISRGMTNKEIAKQLAISSRTVQTHLFRIFRRLGVSSRTEAVIHALREGWITIDDVRREGRT